LLDGHFEAHPRFGMIKKDAGHITRDHRSLRAHSFGSESKQSEAKFDS